MLIGCSSGGVDYKKNLIKSATAPKKEYTISNIQEDKINCLKAFSNNFYDEYFKERYSISENNLASGASMFFALAMTGECASGETRKEILDLLGIADYENLASTASYLFNACSYGLCFESKDYEMVSNSVWLDKSISYKEDCINRLSEQYHASSFQEDFKNDSKGASQRMSDYIDKNTNGLINPKLDLSENTVFALLNTLYLQSIWNSNFEELKYSNEKYDFVNADGKISASKLLHRGFTDGQILRKEKYSSFFVRCSSGARIKFIKPNVGYELSDIMNADTLK